MIKITIADNEAGQRLDRFLRKYLKNATLGTIYKLIRKDVKVNGRRCREDFMLNAGDEMNLYISDERLAELTVSHREKTRKRQFKVVYEDENILAVGKPQGLLTHGDRREKKNTLVNQVCGYLQDKGEYSPSTERSFSPAPVNRLDRNTTGIVIFGKNAESLRTMTAAIRSRNGIKKYYMTIVCGCLDHKLVLDGRLAKDRDKNRVYIEGKATSDLGDAKESLTIVSPIRAGKDFSLAEVELVTGRTHQIRVHLAECGHPLIGDSKYGDAVTNRRIKESLGITTQLLHACRIEFHDLKGELEYLNGRSISMPPPGIFGTAERMLIYD